MEQQIRSVAAVPAISERFVPKAIDQRRAVAVRAHCLLGHQERSTQPPVAHPAHRASWRAMADGLPQQESALEVIHSHLGLPSSSSDEDTLPFQIRRWQFFVAGKNTAITTREKKRANPKNRQADRYYGRKDRLLDNGFSLRKLAYNFCTRLKRLETLERRLKNFETLFRTSDLEFVVLGCFLGFPARPFWVLNGVLACQHKESTQYKFYMFLRRLAKNENSSESLNGCSRSVLPSSWIPTA